MLMNHFRKFGEIDEIIERKGYAFITFYDARDAKKALDEGFSANIDSGTVFYKRGRIEPDNSKELFVNNIGELSEDKLKEYFGRFGSFENVRIPTTAKLSKRRGFAFVTFSNKQEAWRATDAGCDVNIDGTDVYYELSERSKKPEQGKCDQLFVYNVGNVSEAELREYFSQFGSVKRISIPTPKEKRSKNSKKKKKFAFVTFSNAASAQKAADV